MRQDSKACHVPSCTSLSCTAGILELVAGHFPYGSGPHAVFYLMSRSPPYPPAAACATHAAQYAGPELDIPSRCTRQAADLAAARRQRFSVFILAYTTTVREGIESVLFLTSVSASTGAASIPIPGIVGVFLGVLTGMALFYRRVPGPCYWAREKH